MSPGLNSGGTGGALALTSDQDKKMTVRVSLIMTFVTTNVYSTSRWLGLE